MIAGLRDAGVEMILHAGDISVQGVLRELEEIAPVVAVRGNRDWFPHRDLPMKRILQVSGKRIGLTHGHGGLWPYLSDKLRLLIRNPRFYDDYARRAVVMFPEALDLVVFGHNHAPMNKAVDGHRMFNPGSAALHMERHLPPSYGLLTVNSRKIEGEIVYLEG